MKGETDYNIENTEIYKGKKAGYLMAINKLFKLYF